MKKFRKILFSTPALFLYICVVVWAAQTAILSTDTLNEAWTKETNNNSDLQTNIDLKMALAGTEEVTGDKTYSGAHNIGPLTYTSTATPPSSDGHFRYLSGVTGWTSKIFSFYSTAVQYFLSYDTLPTVDGSHPTYNATNDDIDWGFEVEPFTVAFSDESTALTTGTAKVTFRAPYACTLVDVRMSAATAPTGATLTIDVNEAGTTVLSTKLTIDVSELTSTTAAAPPVISDSAIADDAEMTIDIDQVGSTVAGAGGKVCLYLKRTL